ncbi:MAG: CaiB/BaiF CoA-transferase family protein [Chloroflexota bacterium]|nr:CaiB/BaiF CoA-transferase family protein [Chloroflexota bacterium]MDE2884737.1 CaiB/BaiF CoA-transferase family protein [Chloroflexota bacterium]
MPHALDGIRVIDLTTGIAGPGTAVYLADQGAEVIRVEPPPHANSADPAADAGSGYVVQNRNKQSMTLNLATPEGREVFKRLAESSDVLIGNMRLAAARKLGVDYGSLQEINPRLVYASISAYGSKGPYAGKAGYDRLTQGFSGAQYRRWENGVPVSTGIFLSDPSIPMLLSYGITLALLQRERTGRGQLVETSLLHAAIAMQMTNLVKFENSEEPLRDLDMPAYGIYRCADDVYLNVTALRPAQFHRLCMVLEVPHIAEDPRAKLPNNGPRDFREEVYPVIEAVFETRPSKEWLRLLDEADVPVAPVLERDQVFYEPQMVENNMFVRVNHPERGPVLSFAPPFTMSGVDPVDHQPPPLLGEHTDQVLAGLGYSPGEIEELRAGGVV